MQQRNVVGLKGVVVAFMEFMEFMDFMEFMT